MKIKIYRAVVLLACLHGCETWSPTLWKDHFEKKIVKRRGSKKHGENFVMGSFEICTANMLLHHLFVVIRPVINIAYGEL